MSRNEKGARRSRTFELVRKVVGESRDDISPCTLVVVRGVRGVNRRKCRSQTSDSVKDAAMSVRRVRRERESEERKSTWAKR